MDDDLDDLFAEAPSLQLPPPPLPKGLLQRVDELCASGCRQKLAWSRTGCLAYLTSNSRSVILQHLICNPHDGQWTLSKQYELHDIRQAHGDTELVHLSWNHSASEIAVVDVVGRISIHMIMLAMNRLTSMRRCIQDPEDDLSSAVGLMWLYNENPARLEYFYKPMVKTNNVWNFSCTAQKAGGPAVLKDRPGFVSVSRSGTLRVLAGDRWVEAKLDLKSVGGPSELLTHAAICPDKSGEKKDGLYIVTHSSEQELRLYRAQIDLEQLKIKARLLKILSNFGPAHQGAENLSSEHDRLAMCARLSHLDIVPSGPESKSRAPTSPFILVGFSYLADDFQVGGEQATIVCKLEIQASKPGLHASFDSLSAKNSSSKMELPNEYFLRRANDVFIPKILLGIQQVNVSTVLALTYSDGSVEFRDRMTLQILGPDDNDDQVSSLHQIGFAFLGARPCLHAGLSPNAAALFILDENHMPTLNVLQYSKIINTVTMSDRFFERICEGFVLQCSYACFVNWDYTDDLIYALQLFGNQYLMENMPGGTLIALSDRSAFKAYLLSEINRVLGIKIDHSMDEQPDPGFKSPHFQRCLNVQVALGFSGNEVYRSLPGLIAWNMLQSRYCAMVFATACNANKNPNTKPPPGAAENETKNPETVHFLVGLVKWYMDLISYLVDEIFTTSDYFESQGMLEDLNSTTLNQHLTAINSPALFLLLISTSRAILRFDCRLIHFLTTESTKNPGSHTPLGRAYREFDTVHAKAPVDLVKAQDLFSTLDTLLKNAYRSAGLGESKSDERQAAERDMLIKAEIPEVLMGVVKQILTTTADSLREQVNVAELFFADVGWLGLSDGTGNQQGKVKSRKALDAMRKVEMRKEARIRRCTRCCALMEDHMPGRGLTLVTGMQRQCFCGGRWMVLDGSEESNGHVGAM